MPAEDDYTDDYVAQLLKRDAKATSSAALNSGLGSLLNKRPTGSAPKPNTRFLKNLIRDTDSHNTALLAKEAEESRARLRKLREEEQQSRARPERQFYSARSRHDGTAGPPSKRRRLSDDVDEKSNKRERRGGTERSGMREKHGEGERSGNAGKRRDEERSRATTSREHGGNSRDSRGEDHEDGATQRSKRHTSYSDEDRDRPSDRRHRSDKHDRRRSRSPDRAPDRDRDGQHHQSRRHRYPARRCTKRRSPRRDRSPSSPDPSDRQKHHGRDGRDGRDQRHHHDNDTKNAPTTTRPRSRSSASDSDPLDAILGPRPASPPLRSKGRGALNRSAAIDTHFSAAYDPSADMTPEDAAERNISDDWDQALEALRDRQKWRQAGADRLRAAGFSEQEVEKWENQKINSRGEREMDEADVKWGKQGEGREWDRGKVFVDEAGDGDGFVDVKPEWGRLKGT